MKLFSFITLLIVLLLTGKIVLSIYKYMLCEINIQCEDGTRKGPQHIS